MGAGASPPRHEREDSFDVSIDHQKLVDDLGNFSCDISQLTVTTTQDQFGV